MKRKFNIIDVLVVLLIVVVLVGGYLYLNRDRGEAAVISGNDKIVFIAESNEVNPEVCNNIAVGDRLVAVGRYQDAYVTEVLVEDMADVAAKDGQIIQVNDPTLKRLVVTIEATVVKYGPYMEFGGQEVKAGVNYWIKTDKISTFGQVVNVLD